MIEELLKRIEKLEYHQKLMFRLLDKSNQTFARMVIIRNLEEKEVIEFHELCDNLSKKLEEQKAEGFLYFHPLLKEFTNKLNNKLDVRETIEVCLNENLYSELMIEMQKYLD